MAKIKQHYIVEFSNYIVLGFLRIENLYALLTRHRAYSKYLEIPKILEEYSNSPKNKGGNQLRNSLNKLVKINENKDMYKFVLDNIPLSKININDLNGDDIDKLNIVIHKDYNIQTTYFFSNLNSDDNQKYDDNFDEKLDKNINSFIKYYDTLIQRLKQPHIDQPTKQDMTICSIISATEFTNAIHHIYISYYVYKKDDYKHDENINKAIRHLQRAILDIQEALNLSDQKDIKFEHVQKRLNKIYNVGGE